MESRLPEKADCRRPVRFCSRFVFTVAMCIRCYRERLKARGGGSDSRRFACRTRIGYALPMAHQEVRILGKKSMAGGFIEGDEYALRDTQVTPPEGGWRALTSDEVERLVKNNNYAENWDCILVADPFDARQIRNNRFYGLVRIGSVQDAVLEYHDMMLPVGISNSLVLSCDIGNNAAIHNVSYMAHYIVGDRCILFNLDELHTTNYAKFGNGIVKEGESETVRVWLEVMNEGGDRRIMPFDGMNSADAYLWARYRDDQGLQRRLQEITQGQFDSRRGYYGTIGAATVIKNSRILKDVCIGSHCYIKGANKLKNITINSSAEEPSQIGEGVEMVNGIVGPGCKVFYGCKVVRFVLGTNCSLKYGARLINSFLGDNSTISCCEVLNNLIFPNHEQHHNNSFLVASVIKGQSNIAAGATIGSNHNSRANDNEIEAGRGFWPGLTASLKHSSRFASYVLLAKGDYPAELDIPFPFSLVSNNVSRDRLEIMPAYWWRHNMYALARNQWKFRNRDRRVHPRQHIEFDYLAPDTVEEILRAMQLLEPWKDEAEEVTIGGEGCAPGGLPTGPVEKSRRPVVLRKPAAGLEAYREMVLYYAVNNLLEFLEGAAHDELAGPLELLSALSGKCSRRWVNLGGQLVPEDDVDRLREDIASGSLRDWQAIHERYDQLRERYPIEKYLHARMALGVWLGTDASTDPAGSPAEEDWKRACHAMQALVESVSHRVYSSRQKDFENPFRRATFRNAEEMKAVVGTVEDNGFVLLVREETKVFLERLRRWCP
ncbi:MAG: DUF4954 family protein [Spirochaetaceae bacterium]|nr:MAG: DUF4954 family protein [Spirochaetaceae bacterium]